MAGEIFPESTTIPQTGVAADLINTLRNSTEARREKLLTGMTQEAVSAESSEQDPFKGPVKYSEYSPWENVRLQGELKTQLDASAAAGGNALTHKEIKDKLAEVRATVNQTALADGFRLGDITDSDSLKISNANGGKGHDSLTLDLSTGLVSDQSGVNYVTTERDGKISFVKAPALTVQDRNGISKSFDEGNDLTKVTLPDGTTLTPLDNSFGYAVNDRTGKQVASADEIVFDENSLSFHEGSKVISVIGGREVSEDLRSKAITSKDASDPGDLKPVTDPKEKAIDEEIVQRAIANLQFNPDLTDFLDPRERAILDKLRHPEK